MNGISRKLIGRGLFVVSAILSVLLVISCTRTNAKTQSVCANFDGNDATQATCVTVEQAIEMVKAKGHICHPERLVLDIVSTPGKDHLIVAHGGNCSTGGEKVLIGTLVENQTIWETVSLETEWDVTLHTTPKTLIPVDLTSDGTQEILLTGHIDYKVGTTLWAMIFSKEGKLLASWTRGLGKVVLQGKIHLSVNADSTIAVNLPEHGVTYMLTYSPEEGKLREKTDD